MFNRQYFCSAFFFLFATLSLTAIVGCSSISAQETTSAPVPADFERIVERGKLYLYHIVDELEKRGMLNFYYRQAA